MTCLQDLMRNFLSANKYNDAITLSGQLVRNSECNENEDENGRNCYRLLSWKNKKETERW